MFKRIASLFLCCILLFSTLSMPVSAALNDFEFTDNIAQNMVNAALAQMGKKNSDFNKADGMPKDAWCAYFIVWLSRVSGAGNAGILPKKYSGYGTTGTLALYTLDRSKGTMTCFHDSTYNYLLDRTSSANLSKASIKNFTPQPGDLIFFRWSGTTARFATHVGLVYKVTSSKVYYVDGNGSYDTKEYSYSSTYVDTHSLSRTDSQIAGYLRPNYGGTTSAPAALKVNTTTNCRYRVTIPANYKLQCYQYPTSTDNYKYIAANSSSYDITCTQRLDMSDGSTRFFFRSGDGYDLYFICTGSMYIATLHSYTSRVTAATCTTGGYTTKTCTCGYTTTTNQTDPKGHSWGSRITVAKPSCTADGQDAYSCTSCGTQEIFIVPATGHSYSGGICTVCGERDPSCAESPVLRIYGANRYETSLKAADELKSIMGVSKFNAIIVASGTNFADALAGSYLAAQKNAPILIVGGKYESAVKNYIKNNLASGGTVYLLGGVNAVPKSMESGLDGFAVKRLGGATRYDTNLMILQEAGVGSKEIIVCTSTNFADSLSASALGLPILLVGNGLTSAQKQFLSTTSGSFTIFGGTTAVNENIANGLKSFGSVRRIAGSTRYQTSVMVADAYFSNIDGGVLAYAQNFPDGLCGGPLAYQMGVPLLLSSSSAPTSVLASVVAWGLDHGYVLGGPGLISDKIVRLSFYNYYGAGNGPVPVK